jgi:SAM-dependent methyltransferase
MAVTPPFEYVGTELGLFEKAVNWKRYWSAQIARFVHGDVLEVGAGIGANTRVLAGLPHRTYTSLEPDRALAGQIPVAGPSHRIVAGTLADVSEHFDTILYIDVLEHIEDDRGEIARAAAHLRPQGHLIVLAPAHASLYSAFDQSIGHFRRYSRATLAKAADHNGLAPLKLDYLDSVGLLASGVNRLLFSRTMPTASQVLTWDRLMVPVSRVLDPILGRRIGKSVLGVWRREP